MRLLFPNEFLKSAESIGKVVGKIDFILGFCEFVWEAQHVVVVYSWFVFICSLYHSWFTVRNVNTIFFLFKILRLFGHTDPHSLSVKWLSFSEVHNVEFDFVAFEVFFVLYREVKPLVMSPCVCIHSHIEIVLKVFSLYRHVQVSRFKVWVKNEFFVVFPKSRIHSDKSSWILLSVSGFDNGFN